MAALLAAGITSINKSGVDRISVSQVTTLAKHTRPTFYSYFGDIEGFLAELWLDSGPGWLEQLSDPSVDFSKLSPKDKARNRALTEILSASHRMPEVLEVVLPVVAEWWARIAGDTSLKSQKIAWLVGERLGVTLTEPIDPDVRSAAFVEKGIHLIPDKWQGKLPSVTSNRVPKTSTPDIHDESIESSLISATIEVIASSGVAAASMARIARKAQVSTGTVYPRFSKLESLVDSSFELAVSAVIDQNFSLLDASDFGPDDFGLFIVSGLGPSRTVWRNYRVEIHLEGRIRSSLGKKMARSLKVSNARVAEKLAIYASTELTQGPMPYLVHAVGIGFAIMQNAGIDVRSMDHRQITRSVLSTMGLIKA